MKKLKSKKTLNIFDITQLYSDELFETILQTANTRIEKIVSYGQTSPEGFWYDQDENELVTVLEGEAKIRLNDEIITLQKGDYLNIQARTRHRVEYTANPTIWLAVFYK